LEISGERKFEPIDPKERYIRTERNYGKFHRLILVTPELKEEHIKANFQNGLLILSYPKIAPKEKHKRIPIS
jgi:HSP20 family protein